MCCPHVSSSPLLPPGSWWCSFLLLLIISTRNSSLSIPLEKSSDSIQFLDLQCIPFLPLGRSSSYAHFSETLDGIPVIRYTPLLIGSIYSAYQMEPYFIHNNYFKLDHNQQAYFLQCSANCWLGLRLEFAGSLIIIASTMLAVIGKSSGDENFAALAACMCSILLDH